MYGVESWTIEEADRKKFTPELWCRRRLLRIPWIAQRTNISVIQELGTENRLYTICRRRILQYYRRINRRQGINLEKLMVQGKAETSRPRGRSPTRWANQITTITGQPLQTTLIDAGNTNL